VNLRKERQKLGMTQKQFASLAGYSHHYYSNLENGYYFISPRTKAIIKAAVDGYKKGCKETRWEKN
jgi:transcriptional regulator with XRE-family HTH domain